MLDTILIANSGLATHQKSLRVISDNVANMNTPGFKGGRLQFDDVFLSEAGDPQGQSAQSHVPGGGVQDMGTQISFVAGEYRDTGRSLDTAIDGTGFFVLEDAQGNLYYSKTGRFSFNTDGELVTTDQGYKVKGFGGGQSLTSITNRGLEVHEPKATGKVTFTGNLTTQDDSHTIDNVEVYDAQGGLHKLSVTFDRQTTASVDTWSVTVKEGATTISTPGQFVIVQAGGPDPAASEVTIEIEAKNGLKTPVVLSMGPDVTALSFGDTSSLKVRKTDGYPPGTADSLYFDSTGVLNVKFSNGEVKKGGKIAIAEFASLDKLKHLSGSLFELEPGAYVQYAEGGAGSKLKSSSLELSNVDLTSEFSDLVLIQRGYQASSQILSTANEMLQQLLDMKGRR